MRRSAIPSILVVDDRPENLLAIEALLEGINVRLVKAMSGEEALKHVLREDFALILLDVQMPGMTGLETAELIKGRDRSRHVPIIFLTAISKEDGHVFEGYSIGAVDYLFKPFDPTVLRAKVSIFLELHAKTLQIQEQGERLKRAERAARERARELDIQKRLVERLIHHAPAGIAYLDRTLICRSVNPEFTRLAGRNADELLGRAFAEALPENRLGLTPYIQNVIDRREPFRAVGFPIETQDDGRLVTRYWDISYFPVAGEDGIPDGVLMFSLEISDRVENERLQLDQIEHLRQVDELKDEFLSVVSHELRTPLNFIMGFASILHDELAGPLSPEQLSYLERILNGSDRMLLLVNDLLDFAKIQAGKFELTTRQQPYAPLVEEVLQTLKPLADQKQIVLISELQPDLSLNVDEQRVIQLLTNLVGNAIKFTPEGGTVLIGAYADGGHLVTEVQDTGVGIAEEDLPKLFTRFRQLDMSATRAAGGTGLGLSIAKALVEAHGGTISAMSEGLGKGATFRFCLPGAAVRQLAENTSSISG